MKSNKLLLLLLMLAALMTGCATREGALRSKNFERMHVDASAEQISTAAEAKFAEHGFQRAMESNPQAIGMKKTTPILFRSIKGGDAFVWLILEPVSSGWDVYCLAEPDHLYPGSSAQRFRPLLVEIKKSAESLAARN